TTVDGSRRRSGSRPPLIAPTMRPSTSRSTVFRFPNASKYSAATPQRAARSEISSIGQELLAAAMPNVLEVIVVLAGVDVMAEVEEMPGLGVMGVLGCRSGT